MELSKVEFRNNCLEASKNSCLKNKTYLKSVLNRYLQQLLKNNSFKSILFYWPLENEADIRESIYKYRRLGKSIYLPFMEGVSFKMVPFRLPLQKKKFEIYEAGNSLKKINKIDIAVVPVVGVDATFARVGFGKGMYDRFFEKLNPKPLTIFIQTELCFTNKKICDKYDILAKELITSRAVYTKRIRSVKRNTLRRERSYA